MSFRNISFPTGIRYSSAIGPSYSTAIARSIAGSTQRNKNWTYPLRRWRVERALKTNALKSALLAFFHNVNGAGDTFRIKDWTDYTVGLTDSAATGVFEALGNGEFQLLARYTSGAYTKDIPILLPVSGTLTINGGALVQAVDWSTSYTAPSGVIATLGSPTPALTSWSGSYEVHARFTRDDLPITLEDEELFFANDISIEEERGTA